MQKRIQGSVHFLETPDAELTGRRSAWSARSRTLIQATGRSISKQAPSTGSDCCSSYCWLAFLLPTCKSWLLGSVASPVLVRADIVLFLLPDLTCHSRSCLSLSRAFV